MAIKSAITDKIEEVLLVMPDSGTTATVLGNGGFKVYAGDYG